MTIEMLINTLGSKIENKDLQDLKIGDYKIEFKVEIEGQTLETEFYWSRYVSFRGLRLFNRKQYEADPTYDWDAANIRLEAETCSSQQLDACRKLHNLLLGKTIEWKTQELFERWTSVKL